jgi:protein involved in plasmid replication-relaxation
MQTALHPAKGAEKILRALAEFDYLTAAQVTRLCYAKGSLTYVKATLKSLVDAGLAVPLGGRGTGLPRVYTPTGTGYTVAGTSLELPQARRIRPTEEAAKATNLYFLQHTIAVTDILIAAKLLSQSVPDITLKCMYLERELKRKIYLELPVVSGTGKTARRTSCLEPDAAVDFVIVDFVIEDKWQEFFHIEMYRTQLREYRFKQKIHAYAAYAASITHQELFATPALAIAVFCASSDLAATLKRWTEEALQAVQQPELGERFFFLSIDTATASPEELFLSPLWEQPLSTIKTPLLVLE